MHRLGRRPLPLHDHRHHGRAFDDDAVILDHHIAQFGALGGIEGSGLQAGQQRLGRGPEEGAVARVVCCALLVCVFESGKVAGGGEMGGKRMHCLLLEFGLLTCTRMGGRGDGGGGGQGGKGVGAGLKAHLGVVR